MNFKKIAKCCVVYSLYITGLLSAIARIRLRKKAVVLMYHRVLTDEEFGENSSMNGIVVREGTFEKQMKYLAKKFHIISPDDFLVHMQKGISFEPMSCLVTFDDGWKDNFKNALPVLKENKIPALVFLTTGFIGSGNSFWQERLIQSFHSLRRHVGQNSAQNAESLPAMKNDEISKIVCSGETEFREKVFIFTASQKKETASRIEEIIALLNKGIKPHNERTLVDEVFLNWQEIEAMGQKGICFGSHE